MIDTAIVLAAGQGSRLRSISPSKPLCVVGGMTLVDHALSRLSDAGIRRVIVVTGYLADEVENHLNRINTPVVVETVRTPDWLQPNGVSSLAAADLLNGQSALLAMCDHLVDPQLYKRLAIAGAGPGLRLGIDRRIGHPWIDPEDVTCVATKSEKIVAIGKGLEPHDAYDTGVFAVGPDFFSALQSLESPSITEAVRLLSAEGRAEVVDCSDLQWLDVDDPRAFQLAENWLAGLALKTASKNTAA